MKNKLHEMSSVHGSEAEEWMERQWNYVDDRMYLIAGVMRKFGINHEQAEELYNKIRKQKGDLGEMRRIVRSKLRGIKLREIQALGIPNYNALDDDGLPASSKEDFRDDNEKNAPKKAPEATPNAIKEQITVDQLKKGDKIRLEYGRSEKGIGYGGDDAVVTDIKKSQWGNYAVIKKSDGTTDTIRGSSTERGVGWKKVAEHRSLNEDTQVAQTIIQQMGGAGKLRMMLGVKQFVASSNGVSFTWPNPRRAQSGNAVKITLLPSDTYKMEFFNVSRGGSKLVKSYDDVYNDQLIGIFEKQTGWYLHLEEGRKSNFERATGFKKQGMCEKCGMPQSECMCESDKTAKKIREAKPPTEVPAGFTAKQWQDALKFSTKKNLKDKIRKFLAQTEELKEGKGVDVVELNQIMEAVHKVSIKVQELKIWSVARELKQIENRIQKLLPF